MNLNQINDETYEIAVDLPDRKFKKVIDQAFFDSPECSAIFKLHPIMLRRVLEEHLNDKEFFEMEEGTHELTLGFAVTLGYGVTYNMVLKLEEEVEEDLVANLKRKIDELEGRIDGLNEQIGCLKGEDLEGRISNLGERMRRLEGGRMEGEIDGINKRIRCLEDGELEGRIDNLGERIGCLEDGGDECEGKNKIYVLDCAKYDDREDRFVMGFKWALANQVERERFVEVTKKYFVTGYYGYYGSNPIMRVEPLCIEVSGNKAHIFGWFDVNKWRDGIEVPKQAHIHSVVPRMLQHVYNHYNNSAIDGCLMLHHNKLSIIGEIAFCRNTLNVFNNPVISCLSGTDNKVFYTQNQYIVIDTHFII